MSDDDNEERTPEFSLTQTHYSILHRVYQTLFVMLRARGYKDLPNTDMAAMDLQSFIDHCERRVAEDKQDDFDVFTLLRMVFPEQGKKGHHVLVWIMRAQTKDVPIADVQEMIKYMLSDDNRNIHHVIIVSNRRLSNKSLDALYKYNFEHFTYGELSQDPTKHFLVPRHELASEKDVEDMRRQNISAGQMPLLHETDPIAKWNGWKPGQVVKIYQTQPHEVITFRVVCKGNLNPKKNKK